MGTKTEREGLIACRGHVVGGGRVQEQTTETGKNSKFLERRREIISREKVNIMEKRQEEKKKERGAGEDQLA